MYSPAVVSDGISMMTYIKSDVTEGPALESAARHYIIHWVRQFVRGRHTEVQSGVIGLIATVERGIN